MMRFVPVLLAFALACVVVIFLWQARQQEARLRLRVNKLYASQLFEDMTPLIKAARKRPIERLKVDKTGVTLRFLYGAEDSAYLMRPNGYRYLTQEQQEALRVVLEECLPKLRDGHRYGVTRKRVRLLNGSVEYAYHYTMLNDYKATLMRASYYDGSLQAKPW